MSKEIIANENLVAKCGLYCGACGKYLVQKCLGCAKNEKANWCKVRACCLANNFKTCADCTFFSDCNKCRKFNNFISKVFQFIFRSDRKACIERIKKIGTKDFAVEMANVKQQTLKK